MISLCDHSDPLGGFAPQVPPQYFGEKKVKANLGLVSVRRFESRSSF